MDLVYTDPRMKDIGILEGFTADFAFGRDENNYAIQIPFDYVKGKEPIEAGCFFYVDNTEYGGIVDKITVDTGEQTLTYEGRTWRGILASKIIQPPNTNINYKWNFIDAQGDANHIIYDVIHNIDLTGLFDVPYQDGIIVESEVNVDSYILRYDNPLEKLMDMMKQNNGKLMFKYSSALKVCLLYAEPLVNYAALSDIDSSQTVLYMQKNYSRINHVVCIGRWYFENKFVIHLFGDGNGGVLPYLHDMTKEPLEDSDYILDLSQQKFIRNDEITVKIENDDAADVENYKLLEAKPSDWEESYTNYYELSEDSEGNSYRQLEQNIQDNFVLVTRQTAPDDWDSNAQSYYTRYYDSELDEYVYEECGTSNYDAPVQLTSKPAKWKKNYKNYYYNDSGEYKKLQPVSYYQEIDVIPDDWGKNYDNYYTTDGMGNYSPISGDSRNKYVALTEQPSLWQTTWTTYYVNEKGKYKLISEVKPYKDMLAGKPSKIKPPKFVAKKYYVQQSYSVAPNFKNFISVFRKVTTAPVWDIIAPLGVYDMVKTQVNVDAYAPNTYYFLAGQKDFGIEFKLGTYYKKVYDHYASIVAEGIAQLTERTDDDTMELRDNVNVEDRWRYDVGDIAGGTEHITGIETAEYITKKIVHIENGIEDITYEMGGM